MDHIEYVLEKLREAKRKEEEKAIKLCPKCGGDASLPGFTKDGRTVCPKCGYCGATEEFLSPREPSQPLKERWKGESIEAEVVEEVLEEEVETEGEDEELSDEELNFLEEWRLPVRNEKGRTLLACFRCRRENPIKSVVSSNDPALKFLQYHCPSCDWKCQPTSEKREVQLRLMALWWHVGKYLHQREVHDFLEELFGIWKEVLKVPSFENRLKQYFLRRVETYPPLAEIASIATLGVLYAPYLQFNPLWGNYNEGRWDLGILFISPTGTLKSALQKQVYWLLQPLVEEGSAPRLALDPLEFSSPEGIVDNIITFTKENEITSFLWIIDEATSIFTGNKEDYKASNINLFLSLLEGTKIVRHLKGKRIELETDLNRFTVLAGSAFPLLQQHINLQRELETGFFGRWLIYTIPKNFEKEREDKKAERYFTGENPRQNLGEERKDRLEEHKEVLGELKDRLKWLEEKGPFFLDLSEEAKSLYDLWDIWLGIIGLQEIAMGTWRRRMAYNTLKIASVMALEEAYEEGNENPIIEPHHLQYPIYLALNFWIPSYLNFIAQIQGSYRRPYGDPRIDEVLKFIKQNKKGTRSQLLRAFRDIRSEEMTKILNTLLERGEIERVKQGKKEIYAYIGD